MGRLAGREEIDPDPFLDFDAAEQFERPEAELPELTVDVDSSGSIPKLDYEAIQKEFDFAASEEPSVRQAAEDFAAFAEERTAEVSEQVQSAEDSASEMSSRFDELLAGSEFSEPADAASATPEMGNPFEAPKVASAEPSVSAEPAADESFNPFADILEADIAREAVPARPTTDRTHRVSLSTERTEPVDTSALFAAAAARQNSTPEPAYAADPWDTKRDNELSWDAIVAKGRESSVLTLPDVHQSAVESTELKPADDFDSLLEEPTQSITIPDLPAASTDFAPADDDTFSLPEDAFQTAVAAVAPAAPTSLREDSFKGWDDLPFSDAADLSHDASVSEDGTVADAELSAVVSGKSAKGLSGRTWILMVGGLLVVALLLYPERRGKNR
jgi:hypothetical protein